MYEHLVSRERWAQKADQPRRQEQPSARVVAGKVPRSHPPDGEEAAAAERKMAEQESEETSQRQCSCKGRTRLRLAGASL